MWKELKFDAIQTRSTLNSLDKSCLHVCTYMYFSEILIKIIYILAPSSYDPSLILILIKDNVSRKL